MSCWQVGYHRLMTSAPNTSPSALQYAWRDPVAALVVVTLAPAVLLAGAWYFQLIIGLLPCKLCLEQRWPHYIAVALGIAALVAARLGPPGIRRLARPLFGLLALVFAVSTLLGAYHAGVEWRWFAGPSDCAGAQPQAAASMQDFLQQLQTTRVVSCSEAAWRLLGLSLAGWNALFSAALALFALLAARAPQGSSSLSQ
jgi:disulfide bond formation protein DsbB